jgi:hypothetical protein
MTSDSLSGTTSCSALRSLSTAKEELELPVELEAEDEAAPVEERPAPDAPVAPEPVELAELVVLDALLVPVPETDSPTSPLSVTSVPLIGA